MRAACRNPRNHRCLHTRSVLVDKALSLILHLSSPATECKSFLVPELSLQQAYSNALAPPLFANLPPKTSSSLVGKGVKTEAASQPLTPFVQS